MRWLPKRCCDMQGGGQMRGPCSSKMLNKEGEKRGQSGKVWASRESGPGQGCWKPGFPPSLDLGQAPVSPLVCFHSQMLFAFIMQIRKLFEAVTGSCDVLVQHLSQQDPQLDSSLPVLLQCKRTIIIINKEGVLTLKSGKILKDGQLKGVQMNVSWRSHFQCCY